MAYEPIKTEELKKLVMMGKKRPMNMAYNPGPKEADLLIIDRIKAPDVIARVAKKEGEGSKVAFGTFEVDARKFNFTVSQMVPGLSKKLRKYLKSLDMSFTVEIFDLDGTSIESDLDEDGGAPRDAGPPPPSRKELTARLRALQKPIASFGAAGEPLTKAVAKVVERITNGFLHDADSILTQIETTIAKAQGRKPKPPGQQVGQDAKVLMARAASLKGVLEDLPDQAAKAIRGALVQAIALLQSRDFPAAEAKLTAAEKVVNTLSQRAATPPKPDPAPPGEDLDDQQTETAPPAPANPQAAEEYKKSQAAIAPKVAAAMQADKGDTDAIQRAFDYAGKQAEAGKHELALKALAATADLIEQAEKAPEEDADDQEIEAPDPTPEVTEAYDQSRLEWSKTRSGLQAELVKLKMSIDAHTRGINGLEDVSRNTEVLLEYIEELDTSLQDTLNDLVDTADRVQRRKLMNEARQIMADYRGVLDTDFFKAVDGNGFVSTAIRETALTALGEVENALAA